MIMFLDGELNKEKSQDFLIKINKSPEQLALFRKELYFREIIKENFSRHSAPSFVEEKIQSKINKRSSY
jgi:sRNA-binding carbon storage regulator CsrA